MWALLVAQAPLPDVLREQNYEGQRDLLALFGTPGWRKTLLDTDDLADFLDFKQLLKINSQGSHRRCVRNLFR
ncbi:MAG TPA: hypothetical protein VGM23_08585 [Armatimonadota bacterium]|jgi:hypothetical protein